MNCAHRLIHAIEDEIFNHGENKSKYPINIGKDEEGWSVTIEVNTATATFDIEASHTDLAVALQNALTRIRNEFKAVTA